MEKSIDDIEFRKLVLKMHDEGHSYEEISKELNVEVNLIRNTVSTFNILNINTEINKGRFFYKEIEFIRNNSEKDIDFFVNELKRPYYSVKSKLGHIRREQKNKEKLKEQNNCSNKSRKKITEDEIDFVKESIDNGDSIKDISIALERSEDAIRFICHKNKIKKSKNNEYTEEEDRFIREAVKNGLTHKEIGIQIGKSKGAINKYCSKNRIKKAPDIIPDGYKRCSWCRELRPLNDFYVSAKSKDGRQSWCKECLKKRRKELKEKKKNGK